MSKIFQHDGHQVIQVPGGFQVKEMRTQRAFFVRLEIRFRKSAAGPCSCGSPSPQAPVFECRHQRAVSTLIYQRYLSKLARSGLFPHPERLSLDFERRQRRLLSAFSKALRAGPPPCPHCGRTINAEDLASQAQRRGEASRALRPSKAIV
jgi:hypothetical protein